MEPRAARLLAVARAQLAALVNPLSPQPAQQPVASRLEIVLELLHRTEDGPISAQADEHVDLRHQGAAQVGWHALERGDGLAAHASLARGGGRLAQQLDVPPEALVRLGRAASAQQRENVIVSHLPAFDVRRVQLQ